MKSPPAGLAASGRPWKQRSAPSPEEELGSSSRIANTPRPSTEGVKSAPDERRDFNGAQQDTNTNMGLLFPVVSQQVHVLLEASGGLQQQDPSTASQGPRGSVSQAATGRQPSTPVGEARSRPERTLVKLRPWERKLLSAIYWCKGKKHKRKPKER